MKRSFTYIRKTLEGKYSSQEIEAFIAILFYHLFNYSKNEIILNADKRLDEKEFKRIEEITLKLKKNEPIQYILGETEFYSLNFKVNSSVLIPRNETEELVDLIVRKNKNREYKIIDMGTGSGCIPIAIKKNNPQANVYACDLSKEALQVATENAKLNKVDINFFEHDILSSDEMPTKDFDIIVSNPPYVTEKEKTLMDKNVLDNEPHLALFVPDSDPLRFYSAIVNQSERILKDDGELYLEINEAYGQETILLLEEYGFDAQLIRDINGKDRMVYGKKRNNTKK